MFLDNIMPIFGNIFRQPYPSTLAVFRQLYNHFWQYFQATFCTLAMCSDNIMAIFGNIFRQPYHNTLAMFLNSIMAIFGNIFRQHLTMFVQVLLHLCVHIVGCHILIMTQVRPYSAQLKVQYHETSQS